MPKRITVMLDDEAAALLPGLAGGARKQGEFLSGLIHAAAAGAPLPAAAPAAASSRSSSAGDLEALRVQVRGIMSELQTLNARLVTLETREE